MPNIDSEFIEVLGGEVKIPTSFILNNAYHSDGDIVLATSSLIEGIGNKYSDLDIYVIRDRMPRVFEIEPSNHHRAITVSRTIVTEENRKIIADEEVFLIHTVLPGTEIKVDVEFKTFAYFDKLSENIQELFEYACDNLEMFSKYLPDRDNSVIHRIFSAKSLTSSEKFQTLKKKFNRQHYSYIAYRWLASDFSILLDIFGAASKNEWDRCVEMSRVNLARQVQGYLHLLGCTNVDQKWMLTYLDGFDTGEVKLIKKRYLELFYFVGVDLKNSFTKRLYVEKSLDFCDRLFHLSRKYLMSNPNYPSGKTALIHLKSRFSLTHNFSYEKMEYLYRAKAYAVGIVPTKYWMSTTFCTQVGR